MTSTLDLHLHTTFSDGTRTPEETVAEAARRGVRLIALTDHDEVGGVASAQAEGARLDVTVVAGVEINTELGREDVHILGYGFPLDSPVLRAGLAARREGRLVRARRIVGRLAVLGHPIALDEVLRIAGHGSVGRPHVAQALVEAGHVPDMGVAFDRFIGNRGPAYVPRDAFTPEQAIDLIHAAGGLAGVAHPGKLGDPVRILRRLLEHGIDTLEVYHSDHSAHVTERMGRWARQYGLIITGGSDSHGPGGTRVVPIGGVVIPDAIGQLFEQALRERLSYL
jgi:predicted metal-dependent phosphoesterase TrpH